MCAVVLKAHNCHSTPQKPYIIMGSLLVVVMASQSWMFPMLETSHETNNQTNGSRPTNKTALPCRGDAEGIFMFWWNMVTIFRCEGAKGREIIVRLGYF